MPEDTQPITDHLKAGPSECWPGSFTGCSGAWWREKEAELGKSQALASGFLWVCDPALIIAGGLASGALYSSHPC